MTRTKSDAKRKAILDAALELFSGYGYRRTSVEDVARSANIAKGTVYLYFANKEALFAEVCRHVANTFMVEASAAAQSNLALEDKILAILKAKFTYLYKLVHSSPHASEIIQSKNQLANQIFRDADSGFETLLAETLAAAVEAGDFDLSKSEHDPMSASHLLIRCSYGNGAASATGSRPNPAGYNRRLAVLTRVILTGLDPSRRKP